MRKAQIRTMVREAVAMQGYSAGQYCWPRPGRLRILVNADARINGGAKAGEAPMGGAFIELRLASGMSRKALEAALEALPRRGPPKPVAREPRTSTAMQMELV